MHFLMCIIEIEFGYQHAFAGAYVIVTISTERAGLYLAQDPLSKEVSLCPN